jgi:dimethylaniline monooxygenase (N-oxide forming) / hypotaurine monooxygenase
MNNTVDLLVIGAGWAGLYAAKYAREAGLSVQILEARDDLGGVWNYSDDPSTITVMKHTVSSSSRHVTEASDFSMGTAAGNFFTHQDALSYLKRYAEHFDLNRCIIKNARVETTEKTDDIWTVRTFDGRRFTAKALSICTGVHQRRRPITGPVEHFQGQRLHAGDIKHPGDLQLGPQDHVVVYGGGETAADIVQDLAANSKAQITWAIRGGQHFFRKVPLRSGQAPGYYDRNDMALDEYSSAVLGVLTIPEEGKPGMRHRCNVASSGSVFSYQGHGVAEWVNDIPWFRQFFNKNGHAVEHIWNERATPARAIKSCHGHTVVFEDDTSCKATHVICCFGYEGDVSFLPENLSKVPTDKLYQLVFHPDDPSLSFFGFARPTILSLPYMIELQCMLAQQVWSGGVELPDRAARHSIAETDAASLDDFFGYQRSNRNITCPFWYLTLVMGALGKERTGLPALFRRFNPFSNWQDFSRVIRVPLSPFLIGLLVSDDSPEARKRMEEYISPMPFGFRRNPNASLLRYVMSNIVAIFIPRILAFDTVFEWIAKRRIARKGRSLAPRPIRSAAKARSGPSAPAE